MRPRDRTAEEIQARLASAAHGVVTRAGLIGAGLTPAEIRHRLDCGSLIPEHRGVYRVGHRAPSIEARYLAAVRACGDGALLCGRAAAYLFGLIRGKAPPPEVLTPTERRVAGIRTRRSRRIDSRDRAIWRKVPITSVARVLVDLGEVLPEAELARACHEAGVRFGTTPREVEETMARRGRPPYSAKLRRILRGETPVTLSGLEERFLTRLREAGLPLPVTNRPAGGKRVDCRWPDHNLTVELDSYRYHGSRHAWEADRRRERQAHARGDDFRRYTHGDVFEHPRQMLNELRALLR
ncbi:MAG: type IV toxin-antitoxin system AbiEi family antitoxin domain-containing protein [Solirubrobacterales bacterium]